MNTLDDWPRVKRVLEGALACDGSERQAYLAEACGADAVLRARIDRLLAAGDRAETFLETPALLMLESPVRDDLTGRVVDSYQLVSRLGAGGMGEVYLAHDTRLDRLVALKFLSPDLASDRGRLRRFHQEARAASSLNHPHIVVVHDFGEVEGRPYIVTEFIEGETLRHRLRQGALPTRDVVEIGLQVASALAAAHARGLVHRDIKPENIMLRPDGYAKVLDFGLAKLAGATEQSDQSDRESRTQPGIVVGTPRYMSPEQMRGLNVDARSDVWSLGVVLYEMATHRLPFAEDGTSMALDRELPSELFTIICKALQTVRDLRYASGAELCADLKRARIELAPVRPGFRTGRLAAALAIALGALLSFLLIRTNHATVSPVGVQKTVGVLPFDNVNGDARIDHLRMALADEVATALSWTPSLAVRPMAASRRFVDGGTSPQQAGQQLRVGEIVTGHFSTYQSELRVTVEAIEVDGNRLLWRDSIAAPADDSLALGDRLTSLIRNGLLPALGTGAPAYVLRYGGLLEESARECEQAVSHDPTNPLFRTCAQPLMLLARYDRALDYARLDGGSEMSMLLTRLIYLRMGRRTDARTQHDRLPQEYLRGIAPEMFHGLLSRCLAGASSDEQGHVTDDDVRTFLSVREDPEPLYFWASDLAYCGHTKPAIQLLRESIRRNFCASAIETDPMFAAIRGSAEYGELLVAARACRSRFLEHVRARAGTR